MNTPQQLAPITLSVLSILGILLVVLGWNYGTFFKPTPSDDAAKRARFNKQEVSRQEFVRRLFGEAAYRYYRRTDASKEEELWNTLDLIGYPPGFRSPADIYTAKFAYAALGLVAAAAITFFATVFLGAPLFLAVIAIPFTLIGFIIPDVRLDALVNKRREQIIFELPEVAGELSIQFASSNSLPQAINNLLDETAGSYGYLYRELVRVRERYRSGIALEEALEEMMLRNKDVPVFSRLIQRLIFSQVNGLPILDTLNSMADSAWEIVENRINERFEKNKRLSLAFSFLFILSVMIFVFAIAFIALSSINQIF